MSPETYTAVLMQGSGTFGVESVITSALGKKDKLLIAANGSYGERMADIAEHAGISYVLYRENYDQIPSAEKIREMLAADPAITHVAMVHSETTSGILNDIASVSRAVKAAGRTMIVDAMSSFAGVEIPVEELGIDFLISSANKCIQGVPGFSFIICSRQKLLESKGRARSLSLDLYEQWETMEKDGKWRFTSPTHTVRAFLEVFREAGIQPAMEEVRGPMGVLKRDHIRMMLEMERIRKLWAEKYGRELEEKDVDALYARFEPALLGILDQYAGPIPIWCLKTWKP